MPAAALVSVLLTTLLLWSPVVVFSTSAALACWVLCGVVAGWWRGRRVLWLSILAGLPPVLAVAAMNSLLAQRWVDSDVAVDTVVAGTICEFPREQPGSLRFVLTTDVAARAGGLPERILVSWYDGTGRPALRPQPGERWQLTLRLRPPRGLSNPGGFDYERWLFAARIGATGWVRDSAGNARLPGVTSHCRAAGLRAFLAERISTALADRESAPYVLGIAIGAYQALPEAEWARLRRTGTIHLISISGFHIALVAAPAAVLGLLLAGLLLALGRRCRPRVISAWTSVLVCTGYGVLAGFSVPTARSVLGIILLAMLVTWRRTVTVPELVAAVVLSVLVVEPLAPLAPGFWLSFCGVVVLVIVARGLRARATLPDALRVLFVTQLAMTVGLAPLMVLFFGQVPVSGALANLVAVPAFSIVLLPLALLGTAVIAFAPAAGASILRLAADCFDLWRAFVAWCADLPLAVWYLPEPAPWAAVLAGLGAVVFLWPPPWPLRWLGPALMAALLAPGAGAVPRGWLRVTVLDVGQGLAVVVQTENHTLLYDAGPAFRHSDAGERVVVPALQSLGVERLDVLLISHPDADHRGGATSVLERFPAERLLGTDAGGRIAEPCRAGDKWHWDGFEFAVLHPPAGAVAAEDNAGSCVLQVSGARARLLLPGDIEAAEEGRLLAGGAIASGDLVIAAHHGSRTSSTADFVAAAAPRYAVFSTGFRNRWRFPAVEVADRWRQVGACGLNTAEDGALQFESTQSAALQLVRRQRAAAPGVWLARPADTTTCH